MKAVIYARVSSREQEREGYSIPAQIKLLEEYAQRHGLNIVERFSESETAKSSGRQEFNRMIEMVRKSKDIKDILVEKTDRLTRNLKDLVRVSDLVEEKDINLHLVKEGEVISRNSKSQAKFIFHFTSVRFIS